MRRWVATWYAWLVAASCLGRGIPMYREYTMPVRFDRGASELSGEVAIDEAQRLERVAAAARAGIVGEETLLDVIKRGDSPFSERGLAGVAAAVNAAESNEGTRERRGQWLLNTLKLDTFTPTNRAVAQGLGLDNGESDRWNWLFDEMREGDDDKSKEAAGNAESATWGESWDSASAPWPGGGNGSGPAGPRADAPRGGGGTGGAESGNTGEGPTLAGPTVAGPVVPTGPSSGLPGTAGAPGGGNGGSGGAEADLARTREVLAQLAGGSGTPGGRDAGGGETPGGAAAGVSRENFAPDWNSLLSGGSVRDLIAANSGSGVSAGPGPGGGTGSASLPSWDAISLPGGNSGGWGGSDAGAGTGWSVSVPTAGRGGWDSGSGVQPGGMRDGSETWGGSWGGSWAGNQGGSRGGVSTPGWTSPDTGIGGGTVVPSTAVGGVRGAGWLNERQGAGAYRPAWD